MAAPSFLLSEVSQLPFDFKAAVEEYRAAREAHARTIGVPAPVAPHPWVEAAVTRIPPPPDLDPDNPDGSGERFVADYEIKDDTPVFSLEDHQMRLAVEASGAAQAAQARILPPLQRRRVELDFQKASAVANKAFNAYLVDHPGIDFTDSDFRATLKPDIRTSIERYEDVQRKYAAVMEHLADLEHEIHGLTAETLDGWKPAPFPY